MSSSRIPRWSVPSLGRLRSRRRFLETAASTCCGALGAGLLLPPLARAGGGDVVLPNPIPGGYTGEQLGCPGVTEFFHVRNPSQGGDEPSTITDFHGFHGDAHMQGTGIATNTETGDQTSLFYDVDLRFMKGDYVGVDGKHHHRAFALV